MHTQFRKPWTLIAIAFVLIMTVAVRVAEYRMPLWAAQLRTEAVAACEALEPSQSESAATDKAAYLYRQAWEMMIARQRETQDFNSIPRLVIDMHYATSSDQVNDPVNTGVIRLPLPSQRIPEELVLRIRETVESYRPILQVLHEAAAHAQFEHIIVFPDNERYRPREDDLPLYHSLGNTIRLLLLAAMSAVLEGDEAEAVTALESFKAFCTAQFVDPYRAYRSGSVFYQHADDIWRIMAFGIEGNAFSRPTLESLDDLLNYKTTVTRDDLVARMQGGLQPQSYRVRRYIEDKAYWQERERNSRLFPQLGDGMMWYRDRFIMLNGTGELAMSRYMQQLLLSGEVLRLSEEKREYFQRWRYRYGLVVDDLYGRVEPLDFDYLLDSYSLIRFHSWGEERLGIFRIALAAERYRRDKGEFPGNVTDMVPEYLTPDTIAKFQEQKYVYKHTEAGWSISVQMYKTSHVYSCVLTHPLGDIRWSNYY